jgi:hypothetical protein
MADSEENNKKRSRASIIGGVILIIIALFGGPRPSQLRGGWPVLSISSEASA